MVTQYSLNTMKENNYLKKMVFKFATAIVIIECLKQIKLPISFDTHNYFWATFYNMCHGSKWDIWPSLSPTSLSLSLSHTHTLYFPSISLILAPCWPVRRASSLVLCSGQPGPKEEIITWSLLCHVTAAARSMDVYCAIKKTILKHLIIGQWKQKRVLTSKYFKYFIF